MAGDDDDGATVADQPAATPRSAATEPITEAPATVQITPSLPTGQPPPWPPPEFKAAVPERESVGTQPGMGTMASLTTAADALRDEEIERTRLFIRYGWVISIAAIAVTPLFRTTALMTAIFITGLLIGIVLSAWFHQQFKDPSKYNDARLAMLTVICVVNGHFTVLYYGVFTACPGVVVIGIHFFARTELQRLARGAMASAITCYVLVAAPIVFGVVDDPGVFASDDPGTIGTRLAGALFVLGVYVLAYTTARAFREASLKSIEQLRRATRLASQRQALLDELRVDLERALRIGSPGRHTDQIVGEHQLGVLLGRGAMGEVYEAVHRGTGEPAAVKLLRRELLTDPTHLARFLREVKTSSAIDSPHIVKVIETSTPDAALPYLAMERLRGTTLAEQLRKEPRLSARAVADLVRQVGAGIDAASAAKIVHRDLKPQNLMLVAGPPPLWKILDFGVATLAEENSGTLTQGGVVGTPSYMAPEQAKGERVDSRADLYALAVIAYRALTGRLPFEAGDTPGLLYAVVHTMAARPGALLELPADLDRWFAIAIAKAPEARFASGAEQAAALDEAIQDNLSPSFRRHADALIRKHPWSLV